MKKFKLAMATALLAAAGSSFAQTVPNATGSNSSEGKWNGAVTESCNLMDFVDGTVVSNINQTVMSSTLSGGVNAQIGIRVNALGYRLVFGVPRIYDAANQEHTNVATYITPVASGYTLNGVPVASFGTTQGDLVLNDSGYYTAVVQGISTKNTGAAFPAGSYTLKVPVTCIKS